MRVSTTSRDVRRPDARIAFVFITFVALLTTPAPAQTPATRPSAAESTSMERLALARARAALSRAVRDLKLSGAESVGQWASRDAGLDRALRGWLRGVNQFSPARSYSDGSVEVDIQLLPDALGAQLLALREHYPAAAGDTPSAAEIRAAAKGWAPLWTTGVAARGEQDSSRKPPGWEDVTPEGAQLARLAASADAIEALLENSGRLKVTAARRLEEFLNSNETVRNAVSTALREKARVTVETAADQLAVAEARIAMPEFIRILTEVFQNSYQGDLFHAADFREMALISRQEEIASVGLAPPPNSAIIHNEYELIELDAPTWISTTISAKGRFTPRFDEEATADEKARLARADGVDQLRRQVEALALQGDFTVERFLEFHPELKDDIVVFLSGARPVGALAPQSDGGATLTVELPLRRLWWIVRRGMSEIEVDPDALDASNPPTTQPIP